MFILNGPLSWGWFIFVFCVIPIPLFFLYNYIQEYLALRRVNQGLDDAEKPRYLEAFTRNNASSIFWGLKRACDQTGRYAHLRPVFDDGNYEGSVSLKMTENLEVESDRF